MDWEKPQGIALSSTSEPTSKGQCIDGTGDVTVCGTGGTATPWCDDGTGAAGGCNTGDAVG